MLLILIVYVITALHQPVVALLQLEITFLVTVFPCRVWPALVLLLFPFTAAAEESSLLEGWYDIWLFRFLVNMLGYSTIVIPGYLLICYFKRINYLETGLGLLYVDI